ncbi:hypothetical protein Tco_1284696 [Tanacetum coccineum]
MFVNSNIQFKQGRSFAQILEMVYVSDHQTSDPQSPKVKLDVRTEMQLQCLQQRRVVALSGSCAKEVDEGHDLRLWLQSTTKYRCIATLSQP